MKRLIIGFSTRNTILSWIIRKWQKTPFSHTFILFDDTIIQASGTQVNSVDIIDFIKKNKIVETFALDLDEQVYNRIKENAKNRIGLPYSWRQLFDIFLSDLFKRNIMIFHDRRQAYICSELVAETMRELKYPVFDWEFDYVTPKDIWHLLIANRK